jgi:hypothetical protein
MLPVAATGMGTSLYLHERHFPNVYFAIVHRSASRKT